MPATNDACFHEPDIGSLRTTGSDTGFQIAYSRERTIAAFTDYYKFIQSMYMHEDNILYAPVGGWPEITPESMASLAKTDEVVALLRELPYVRRIKGDTRIHCTANCQFADWTYWARGMLESRSEYVRLSKRHTQGLLDLPSHVVGPADNGGNLLLDTRLGVIYSIECPSEIREDPSIPYKDITDDVHKNGFEGIGLKKDMASIRTIPEFFEVLKHQFTQLNHIPFSGKIVEEIWADNPHDSYTSGARGMVQNIFREHGWPMREVFEKRECMKAVSEALAKHYPGIFFHTRDEAI